MKNLLRSIAKTALQQYAFPGGFFWRTNTRIGNAACLTFDDGPNPEYTPEALKLLGKHDIKAMFFVVGEKVAKHPEIAQQIVEAGHAIGGHTYTHKIFPEMTQQELSADLIKTRDIIKQTTGQDTTLFRPPRGLFRMSHLKQTAALGYQMVHWTTTYSDYKQDGEDALLERMQQNQPQTRDIILLHDNNPYTLSALDKMLPVWKDRGLQFSAEL